MSSLPAVKYRHNETLRMETATSRATNNLMATKQGIVTDTFINDRNGEKTSLTNTSLPDDLNQTTKNDKNTEKSLLSMVGIPLAVLGAGTLITGIITSMHKKMLNPKLTKKSSSLKIFKKLFNHSEKPPLLPPNNNVEKETQYGLYEALREPTFKRILGAMLIFAFSSAAFVLKNTTDGLKEIWVKKKDADIQRDYQEKMINIETRSFAGKKQIVRHMLDEKTKELKMFNKSQNISFEGNKDGTKEQTNSEKTGLNLSHVLIGLGALAASVFLMKGTVKNIKTIIKRTEKALKEDKLAYGKSLAKKAEKDIKPEKISEEMSKREFTNKECQDTLKGAPFTKETKQKIQELVEEGNKKYAPTHSINGDTKGRLTVYAFLNDPSAYMYRALMVNDKFAALVSAGFSALAGVSYAGVKFVEANKEVQVKKVNAETDLDMHDKLVRVELLNFMKKKEIAVKPLVDGYKNLANTGSAKVKELKDKYNGVMNEIKTGPPFIYD